MKSKNNLHARKSPDWLKQSVIYQLFLRTFTPQGTIREATKRLGDLSKLGIDIIYLCPICLQDDDARKEFWSNRQKQFDNPRNPYRVKDYEVIDPEYGSDDDLLEFTMAAHRLGMRVILDVVFFHCGPTATLIEKHPDFVKRNADGSVYIGTWNFPVLNFESNKVREYFWNNLEYWVRKFSVDGYRCDVSDHIPLDFWETARSRLEKIKSDIIILAESERKEDHVYAFDMNYSFPWTYGIHAIFNQQKPVSSLREKWEKANLEYPRNTFFIRFTEDHDAAHNCAQGILREPHQSDSAWREIVEFRGIHESGLKPDSRVDKRWGTRAVDATLVLNFTIDGIPFLYNGQEVADISLHNIYGKIPIDWSHSHEDFVRCRYQLCQDLCKLRHSEPTLVEGAVIWLDHDKQDHILSYIREGEGEQILVLINLSSAEIKIAIPSANKRPADLQVLLERGVEMATQNRGMEFKMEAFGYFVGKYKATDFPTNTYLYSSTY